MEVCLLVFGLDVVNTGDLGFHFMAWVLGMGGEHLDLG